MKFIAYLLFSLSGLYASLVQADSSYPTRPLRWIVPYAAGGASDTLIRTVADAMGARFEQPIIIDNRPGAATNVGVQNLMQAKPDGYTIMQAENAALFFNEHMFSKLSYKPGTDFTYISAIGRIPVVLVTHPSFPAKTLAEFIDYAKANPGKIDYASPGIGTSHHMAMEMFAQQAGIKVNHVGYKGGAAAILDVMSGQVPVMVLDLTVGSKYIQAKKVRPLAVASFLRVKSLAETPTFIESGYKDLTAYTVHGVIGPAQMPTEAVSALNVAVQRAVQSPKVHALMDDTGFEPLPGKPEDFKAFARSESERWGKVIKATSVKLD